jgi:hypothetical protein
MSYPRLHQVFRILHGLTAAFGTWQGIMRRSGPDASIQLVTSALSSATHLGSTFVPSPMFIGQGPERLDLRTRFGFLLSGVGSLLFAPTTARLPLQRRALERQNRVWGRNLARRPLWTRLTGAEPHGGPFTVTAAMIALVSAIATYRRRVSDTAPPPGPFAFLDPWILGEVFPTLPIVGLARQPRTSPRWLPIVAVPAILISVFRAIASLRAAFMSQEAYQKCRISGSSALV